jgi:hypothetical protein
MIGSRVLGDNDWWEDSEALKVKCIGSVKYAAFARIRSTPAQHFKYSFPKGIGERIPGCHRSRWLGLVDQLVDGP